MIVMTETDVVEMYHLLTVKLRLAIVNPVDKDNLVQLPTELRN